MSAKRSRRLPRHVFEPELEMRMLINSVMTRVEGEVPIVSRCRSVTSPVPMTRGE